MLKSIGLQLGFRTDPIFRTLKPIVFDCDAGAMNRQIRLAVCSLPYICEKSTHTWVFATIYI